MISEMVEPVFGILFGYPGGSSLDDFFEQVSGAGLRSTQTGFELTESQLNGVKVQRIRRQVAQPCPVLFHDFVQAFHLVHRQVVEHHHGARSQSGTEHLVEISSKHIAVGGSVEAKQSPEPAWGQGGNERLVRAAVQRHSSVQALAGRGLDVTAAVLQVSARLVHEHKTGNICFLNSFHKQAAQGYNTLGIAFGGVDTFSLRSQPRRSTAYHTAARCSKGPPAATRAWTVSANVASGCAARQASRHWSPTASRRGAEVAGQLAHRTARVLASQQFIGNDSETAQRAATKSILASGPAHAAATLSRKSYEYAFMFEDTTKPCILTPKSI